MNPTDKLNKLTKLGYCPCLIFDDDGNWALSFESTSSVWEGKPKTTTVVASEDEWKPTIDEAIDYAIKKEDIDL